jgi:hypothetical protein
MASGGGHLERARGGRAARLGLTIAMGVAALNVWTGAPLVALWVGSQAQGPGHPTMTSVGVVVVVFAALGYGLVALLGRLGQAHDRLTGARPSVRAHAPWLRSMRGERERYDDEAPRLTGLERVLVVTVVIVVVVFEIWFLFYSTSPIDSRSGRGAVDGPERGAQAAAPQEGSSSAMRNEEPQPHEATTLGFFTSKPEPIMLSVKSTSEPST